MNLLLLIFDDLVPLLGCHGDTLARTPNIDRLAGRGVTFTNASTPCAICAPGRACVFTGLRPDTHGVTTLKQKLRGRLPDVVTWPQALRSRGWYTMRSGKVYHKGVPEAACFQGDGDDDPYSWVDRHNPGGMELNCNGVMRNLTPWQTHTAGIGGAVAWLRAEKGDRSHHDTRVADDLIASIATGRDGPSLWAAGFIRPHVPLVAPKRFFALYDDVAIDLPEPPADATPVPDHVRSQWCGHFGLDQDQRREAIRAYRACVAYVDHEIGRILDALEASGKADDTVVLLTGDHGYQLGEHGLWFKNFLYRESLHIPLVIADPRRGAGHGRTCSALVDQCDLFPTVMDLTDSRYDQALEGRSLVPLLEDPTGTGNALARSQVDWGRVKGRRVTDGCHALVQWSGAVDQTQLFDLVADPGEHRDLLHNGGHHPAATALAAHLST